MRVPKMLQNRGLTKYRWGRWIQRHLARGNRIIITKSGFRMLLDKQDSMRLSLYGEYEPKESELLKELVQEGDTVVDVGAHIGYFTLQLANLVGETGRVFAFEPEPNNFELLCQNIRLNNFENVIAEPLAIADCSCTRILYRSSVSSGMHTTNRKMISIFESYKIKDTIEVPATSLDSYFERMFAGNCEKISFLKMDIEGGEIVALQGMMKLIERNPNMQMLIEIESSRDEYMSLLRYFNRWELIKINEKNVLCLPRRQQ